jgi:hypothetical protein
LKSELNPNKDFECLVRFFTYNNQDGGKDDQFYVLTFEKTSGNILKFYNYLRKVKYHLKDQGLTE